MTPCCELEIVDERGQVLKGTQTKVVGQRVQLTVRCKSGKSAVTAITWAMSAASTETVKTYVQTRTTGTAAPLTLADAQAATVSFYWLNGALKGASRIVTVTATVCGQARALSLLYRVLRPRMDRFTLTTSSVNRCAGNFVVAGTFLAAYDPQKRAAGSQWKAQVTAPDGGDGRIAFTQLIHRNAAKTLDDGTVQRKVSPDPFVLDDAAGIQYSGAKAISAGGQEDLDEDRFSDSPGLTLDQTLTAVQGDDRFELYLMYRPDGSDSIWVTLGKGTWSWSGKTTRIGAPGATTNDWTAATDPRMSPSSRGVDSIALPTWTHNASSTQWV